MTRRLALVGALVGSWGFGACGGSAVSEQPAAGIAFEQTPTELAAAICKALESCFGEATELFLGGSDCQLTMAKQFENSTYAQMQQAEADGTGSYDASKMPACLAAIEAMGCSLMSDRIDGACEAAFEGTVELGGACKGDLECAGARFCKIDSGCPGVCTERLAAGASCDSDDQCQSGLVCFGGPEAKCTKPLAAGSACVDVAAPCTGGTLCAGKPAACTTLDDLMQGKQGESCDPQAGDWCEPGLYCVIESVGDGELTASCGAGFSSGADCKIAVPEACPSGEYCNADIEMGKLDGTCVKLPGDGESCVQSVTGGAPCAPGAVCVEGTCKAVKENGAACQADVACYSESCVNGKCAVPDQCLIEG